MKELISGAFIAVWWLVLVGGGIATWLTHVIFCFQSGNWGFLIAGALFFPIANVHGLGLWLGWWG